MKSSKVFTDKKALAVYLNAIVSELWPVYIESWPKLAKFDQPTIEINNRLTRTAGRCFQELNCIEISGKFFQKEVNRVIMINVILVHEIAHQIDFNLNGTSEKKCGHGKNWEKIMVELGLAPNKYHSLTI